MKTRLIASLLIPLAIIFSNIKQQRGRVEGGQIEKNLTDKSDWWGSILPLISFSQSKVVFFGITIISVLFYWIGISLILLKFKFEGLKLTLFLILSACGAIFAAQNIRDALLFSLTVFTIGLSEKFIIPHVTKTYLIPLFFLILMTSFKYVTAISICMLLIYRYLPQFYKNQILRISVTLIFTLFVFISGVTLDKSIAKVFSLEKSFPEQQVMYQDLASFYCWSQDSNTRYLAMEGLKHGLLSTNEPQNICIMHRPNAWVYLIGPGTFGSREFTPPLRQLQHEDLNSYRGLRSGWINTIISDPVDYIQFKFISATQILTTGNPFNFTPNEKLSDRNHNQIVEVSNFLWYPFEKLSNLIGESYIFSILFLIVLILIGINTKSNIWHKSFLLELLFFNMLNLLILSIAFVSDEARYTFPFLFINYLYLIVTGKFDLGPYKKIKNRFLNIIK